MKSNTKGKLILICLAALLSLSFVFGSNIANYPVKLSETSVNTSEQNLGNPRVSTNGAFKIYWEANGTALTDSQDVWDGWNCGVISDGQGGAIIAWIETKGGAYDVYAQKINSNGERLWTQNGMVICNATNHQYALSLCTDGAEGAIITWYDWRISGSPQADIYAQHVDSDGKTHWGDEKSWGGKPDLNGTVICNATEAQGFPRICSVEGGGAIITWNDYRNGVSDIYAQYVDSNGDTHWGESFWSGPSDLNGTVICNATANQFNPQICSVKGGGAIITWDDNRRNGDYDIYAQYVDSDGDTHWGDEKSWGGKPDLNGTVICNATETQGNPRICSVEGEGAFITWEDERTGIATDIYAQHVSSDGKTHWGESFWSGPSDLNGTVICNATDSQSDPLICSDEAGGAFITWKDWRSGSNYDIYAQRLSSDGTTYWGDGSSWGDNADLNGSVICNALGWKEYYSICADGGGGAIIAWSDPRSSNDDVYIQRVSSDGTAHWGDGSYWGDKPDRNGTVICNVEGNDAHLNTANLYVPSICSDMKGGAIVAFFNQTTSGWNMGAQRVRGIFISGGGLPAGDDDDDDDNGEEAIPFGNYYLGFAVLAIVALIIIYKRKTILSKR